MARRSGRAPAYLQRLDLGRRLDADSRRRPAASRIGADVALAVADGLSALAAQTQAPPVLAALVPRLRASGLTLAPLALVRFGRLAVEDEVGAVLGARAALILLGERPGLGSADSLGAYLVYDPRPGRTDAERNCVSNIRPAGLTAPAAADLLHYLLTESLRRRLSGVRRRTSGRRCRSRRGNHRRHRRCCSTRRCPCLPE